MRRCQWFVLALAATVLACLAGRSVVPAPAAEKSPPKTNLRVLYVGHPDSEREKDFVGFLGQQFAQVGTADLQGFQDSQARGSDVIILDYDGDAEKTPRPKLSQAYTRPTLTVGMIGSFICRDRQLKTAFW
jgi:hypothetical protein